LRAMISSRLSSVWDVIRISLGKRLAARRGRAADDGAHW
jgi:hypothetical protein